MSEMNEEDIRRKQWTSSTEENVSETKEDEKRDIHGSKQPKQQRTLMQKLPKRIPKILIRKKSFLQKEERQKG